jgi:hypothetical protein
MRAYSVPFWTFLISVYRALGKGKKQLTAMDALWFGLIDTVQADDDAIAGRSLVVIYSANYTHCQSEEHNLVPRSGRID